MNEKSSILSSEKRAILSGNEAIVRGAIEAGVKVVSSYPGGPVTEILENMAKLSGKLGIYAEWSTNEKVALEVGIGSSLAGQRALVAFKDVGLNAAYDTFMGLSRGGCRAGLVIVIGQDGKTSPDMQDCRYAAEMAHFLTLDPADPQEAKEMTAAAFTISERLELPVILMPSSHICYGRGEVELKDISTSRSDVTFIRDESSRYMSVGMTAVERVGWLHERMEEMREIAEDLRFNDLTEGDGELGVAVPGHLYRYVSESLKELDPEEEISLLKLGSVHPLPSGKVTKLCASSRKVLVLEELEPFIEDRIRSLTQGVDGAAEIRGKLTMDVPLSGYRKMDPGMIKKLIGDFVGAEIPEVSAGEKAPSFTLCPGCLHRSALEAVKLAVRELGESDFVVTGDQGCSLLLSLGPERILDTEYHMGSSIGVACGLVKAGYKKPVIAAIGDSAFYHNGVSALMNAVYNDADVTILVLDNAVTAMTGLNPNPSSGVRADGSRAKRIPIEDVARGCKVESVRVVDPREMRETVEAIKEAIKFRGPAVVVARGPCVKALERQGGSEG